MCGRYGLNHPDPVLAGWHRASSMPEFRPRYNIAPTMDILTMRETASSRIGSMMRWGLIPFWAKDLKKIPVMNNARAETVADKPMFRQALRERRCLIPASGFFEWKAEGRGKQPFFISSRDDAPFSFAGIWGTWTTVDPPNWHGVLINEQHLFRSSCLYRDNEFTVHKNPYVYFRREANYYSDMQISEFLYWFNHEAHLRTPKASKVMP